MLQKLTGLPWFRHGCGKMRLISSGRARAPDAPMRIKVQDGTPVQTDSSLCTTCRCSTIVRGRTLDEELILCNALGLKSVQITFKVTSCSEYADCRMPSYMEMMQDAWILRPGSRRRPAGFVRASELEQEEMADFHMSAPGKRHR